MGKEFDAFDSSYSIELLYYTGSYDFSFNYNIFLFFYVELLELSEISEDEEIDYFEELCYKLISNDYYFFSN